MWTEPAPFELTAEGRKLEDLEERVRELARVVEEASEGEHRAGRHPDRQGHRRHTPYFTVRAPVGLSCLHALVCGMLGRRTGAQCLPCRGPDQPVTSSGATGTGLRVAHNSA
jgi:hypothetical protein